MPPRGAIERGELVEAFAAPAGRHDRGPRRREHLAESPPEAGGGPGDQGDLAGQIERDVGKWKVGHATGT